MYRPQYAHLEIFRDMTRQQIEELYGMMEACSLPKDRMIFEQGQTARYLYILLEGEVNVVYKPYDGPPLSVARIEPGGVFGWSAALGRDVYTSGAMAEKPCKALRISPGQLHNLCEVKPEIGGALLERLASGIAERIRNTHTSVLDVLSQSMDISNDCIKKAAHHE